MKRAKYLALLIVFVLALTAVATACGGGGQTTSQTTPVTTQTTSTNPYEIIMNEQNVFLPSVLTVPAGTKVTWSNKSVRRWWVVSVDKKIDSGQIATGVSVSFTFNEPGTYEYYDTYNKDIRGTVIVQ
jgi:plastocyanin